MKLITLFPLIGLLIISNICNSQGDNYRDKTHPIQTRATANCEVARTSAELNINNVRAKIHSIGDMWWDLQYKAHYIVPADGTASALFAGCLWVGGKDANNQIKVATTMFRQGGVDFASGPLIATGANRAETSIDVCRQYDKLWSITKAEVKEFRMWWNCQQDPNCNMEQYSSYTIPDVILNWPAHGPEGGYDMYLAPFWDNNNDGYYNPYNGDFPYFEFPEDGITDDIDCLKFRNKRQALKGDQAIWYVFNDAGKEHSNSGSQPIGLEIRAIAYAYATNTPINDLTFYNYEIINRSTETLYEAYVGFWTDVDLGYPKDDYIGCDVGRGLGYVYNGDNNDETADGISGYGASPPAVGLDFFEGLFKDSDGQDNETSYEIFEGKKVLNCSLGDIMNGNINGQNFEDGIIDNERWGLTNFTYFSGWGTGVNPFTIQPTEKEHYYYYLTSRWLNGTHVMYGGTGHPSGGATDVPSNFMYSGSPTSDICGYGQNGLVMSGWSEEQPLGPGSTPNAPRDVRFVISSGPVTFKPGAVNNLTMGVVYGRSINGGNYESIEVMKRVDDIAQNLFDNCFRILEGPDAPELKIVETNNKLIFYLLNNSNSNNYLNQYTERDYNIKCDGSISPCDEYYRFQGYQVYQLKYPDVDILKEKYNSELVREVFQCDIKDGISSITNYIYNVQTSEYMPHLEVEGNNEGIFHTFVIEKDYFAKNDDYLTNQKDYWYTVVAYAANKTLQYSVNSINNWYGNKNSYLVGKNNIKTYTATPHDPTIENNGTVFNTEYGFSPQITMTEGHGNANCIIELSNESLLEIMSGYPWKIDNRTYKSGKGPITVKIIDPLNVPDDLYTVKFDSTAVTRLSNGFLGHKNGYSLSNGVDFTPFNYTIVNSKGDEIESEVFIQYNDDYEQLFLDWGFSILVKQVNYAAYTDKNDHQNGFLAAELIFAYPEKPWLNFIADQDYHNAYNWIRVGTQYIDNTINPCQDVSFNDYTFSGNQFYDKNEYFEKVIGGTWAPFMFTSDKKYGLSNPKIRPTLQPYLQPISSVDLIITSDKSKWTRSCVVEMHENAWQTDECGLEVPVVPTQNYLSIGNAHKFSLRKSPSIDKEGNVDNSGTYGMGWFPGYAIDQRTGRRLNIIYGEDSWLASENGKDMMWNPTSGIEVGNVILFGGKHYIYIIGDNQSFSNPTHNAPHYDSCQWIYNNLLDYEETGTITSLQRAWASAMWCAIPLQNPEFDFLACDVRIKLRVATPYHKGMEGFTVENPENDNFPVFKFSTHGLQAETSNSDVLTKALEKINIVPNPYYWGNHYGNYTYDKYVRIINLPKICEISIFNASGFLINRMTKNDSNTFYEWDMTDRNGNLIANGMYIIHVKVPGVGDKVLKWFGSSYQE
ncbi:MAG: hypothetical protein PHZ24_02645 [Bacteroidales bacterium]|nr:hypothetical protein [Bacteroidales bacterium]